MSEEATLCQDHLDTVRTVPRPGRLERDGSMNI